MNFIKSFVLAFIVLTATTNIAFSQITCCNNTNKLKMNNNPMAPSCKLTTPELQKRKETILASLKEQIIETKEFADGYSFKFIGTDDMLDQLVEFVKTERECCSFFTFNLSINGDKSEVWLSLTGGDGTKDFILTELGWSPPALNIQSTQVISTNQTTDSLKTATVKVKGITCSTDLKMISANVEKVNGVSSCKAGKQGTTTTFEVKYNPTLVTEKEVFAAIENTGSCENTDERPYKIKQ